MDFCAKTSRLITWLVYPIIASLSLTHSIHRNYHFTYPTGVLPFCRGYCLYINRLSIILLCFFKWISVETTRITCTRHGLICFIRGFFIGKFPLTFLAAWQLIFSDKKQVSGRFRAAFSLASLWEEKTDYLRSKFISTWKDNFLLSFFKLSRTGRKILAAFASASLFSRSNKPQNLSDCKNFFKRIPGLGVHNPFMSMSNLSITNGAVVTTPFSNKFIFITIECLIIYYFVQPKFNV